MQLQDLAREIFIESLAAAQAGNRARAKLSVVEVVSIAGCDPTASNMAQNLPSTWVRNGFALKCTRP
jgi:hypothetical protein